MEASKKSGQPWFLFGSYFVEKAQTITTERSKRMSDSKKRQENKTHTEIHATGDHAADKDTADKKHLEVEDEMGKPANAKKLFGFIVFLLVFMVLCAVVFCLLESTNEREQMNHWKTVKENISRQLNLSDKELLQLLVRLDGVKKYGLSTNNRWNFYNSFWFTMTITTTIGFGRIAPVTTGGRLFCILCGILGIPLNALVLKHVGNKIRIWITNGIRVFEIRWLGHLKCKNAGVKCACVTFLVMILVILLGGCLDLLFDGWTFVDGVYFNFIALSTIGFGDIYPSVNNPSKLDDLGLSEIGKRFLASGILLLYLTLGLAVVSTVVVSILNAMEEVEKAKEKIASWRRNGIRATNEENGDQRRNNDVGKDSENLHGDYGIFNDVLSLEERGSKAFSTRF